MSSRSIHRECGHTVTRQVPVAAWDRWQWHCTACGSRGVAARAPPAGPCATCGTPLHADREEAILDLEVRSAELPCVYFDITVRHSIPGDVNRLAAAAGRDGAVAKEAEGEKRRRYPDGESPWRMVPLALETYGRHGKAALQHLRKLARAAAAKADEEGDAETATSSLVARWGAQLSAALHRANAARLRSCLGSTAAGLLSAAAAAEPRPG